MGTKEKWKKMSHTLVSLGTKDRRTWCIHTDIRPRICLFGGYGYRVYSTKVTHVKRSKWCECFPILWSHLCDYEIPICWFFHHRSTMLSFSICNLLFQLPFLSTPLVPYYWLRILSYIHFCGNIYFTNMMKRNGDGPSDDILHFAH